MIAKSILQFALFLILAAALLFPPAGTLAYPGAWAFLALTLIGGGAIGVWLYRNDPRLFRERMSSPVQRAQKPWDRVFLVLFMLVFVAWMPFMAWDAARHDFRAVPAWAQTLGAIGVVIYMIGVWLTFRENSFAAPVVKIQEGQRAIDTGPYAIVRHPMYASALFLFVGMPLLLNSLWGLLPAVVMTIGLAWRAVNEERVLRAELSGYEDYARRVRYRFAPFIW
jgi:protein-S-isoprenylcysteine O-methyltransferase Ste14